MPNADLESQFKDWLQQYSGAVLKIARAYTLTAEDRQDLAQEILLQIWRSLPQFEQRASAATWFYRVALNTALSWHRDEKRRQTHQRRIVAWDEVAAAEPPRDCPLIEHETVERLYVAIRRLPKTDAALMLMFLDDLSYRQIAEVLGISESNVGVKLNRAKKVLGALMSEASP